MPTWPSLYIGFSPCPPFPVTGVPSYRKPSWGYLHESPVTSGAHASYWAVHSGRPKLPSLPCHMVSSPQPAFLVQENACRSLFPLGGSHWSGKRHPSPNAATGWKFMQAHVSRVAESEIGGRHCPVPHLLHHKGRPYGL